MKNTLAAVLPAAVLCAATLSCAAALPKPALPKLTVAPGGHFLQHSDGSPFFYLGDTAWELFHRLTREEAAEYLKDRAGKGFTVIQAVALAELDGLGAADAYGRLPLKNRSPLEPDTCEGEDNDYWDDVDYIVREANSLGMYVGLIPAWGSFWNDEGAVLDADNAAEYGRFIAGRFKGRGVIWILGGDRNPDDERKRAVIRAMAEGIRSVDKESLMTFHPGGRSGSSEWFHDDGWLSFNGRQNGHASVYRPYASTLEDYRLSPAKPVADLEPLYEDHPIDFRPDEEGHSTSADVRRALYWDVFNGACGVAYGHHSVWQMYDPAKGRSPVNLPLMTWRQALGQPASAQAGFLRRLVESRPFFSRVPAPEFIIPSEVPSAVPGGNGRYRITAAADSGGTYAFVYAPVGRAFSVRAGMLKGVRLTLWLFNPRTGKAVKTASLRNDGTPIEIRPPSPNEAEDWVWVIDDASKGYPAPGSKAYAGE